MNRRQLIIFAVLIVSLAVIVSVNRSPFGRKNTSLAVPAEKEITRIELSGEHKKLVLLRNGDTWVLNDKLETRKSGINHLIRILREMTIKSTVSADMYDRAIVKPKVAPVRVRAYENHHLLSDFLVYKTQSNVYGNIMKRNSRSKPFIFYVPGHDADIGSAFTLNELYWQPYTIFNIMPSEIRTVKFENEADTSMSFVIRNNRGKFMLTDGKMELKSDSSVVKRYLSYFTFIPFESWETDMNQEAKAKIINSTPLYRLIVSTAGGKDISLTLWERLNEKGEKDSDRLYGKTGDSDEIFVVRYFDIDPVLKRRDFFTLK